MEDVCSSQPPQAGESIATTRTTPRPNARATLARQPHIASAGADAPSGTWSDARAAEPEAAVAVEEFLDAATGTLTYLVYHQRARVGIVIDPVCDIDARGRARTAPCEQLTSVIDALDIDLQYAFETCLHDGHRTGVAFFQDRYGATSVIGAGVTSLQRELADLFAPAAAFATDGRQFDVLVNDGDRLSAGPLHIEVFDLPCRRLASVAYRIGDALFVGDAFWPSRSRASDPVRRNPRSIRRLRAALDDARVFPGRRAAAAVADPHDWKPSSLRAMAWKHPVLRWNLCAGRPCAELPSGTSV